MNCPFCGNPISDNADFCDYCGFFLSEASNEKSNDSVFSYKQSPAMTPNKNNTSIKQNVTLDKRIIILIIVAAVVIFLTILRSYHKPDYYGTYYLESVRYEYNGKTSTVKASEAGLSTGDIRIDLNESGTANVSILGMSNSGADIDYRGDSINIVYSNRTIYCDYDKAAKTLSVNISNFDGTSIDPYGTTTSNPFLAVGENSSSLDGKIIFILKKNN